MSKKTFNQFYSASSDSGSGKNESAKKVLSLEFFPPKKTDGLESTKSMIKSLARFAPDFMTCTYGAGGSTREFTREIVKFIAKDLNIPAVAHLTCVGHSSDEIDQVTQALESDWVCNILALRGDPPKGEEAFVAHPDGFACARDLVKHLKKRPGIGLAVAGYPETHSEAISPEADLDYLKEKVDAGAELVITQLFFEADIYFRFLERVQAAGINVPISPGIMPIGSVKQVRKFTQMCGASIPPSLAKDLEKLESSPESVSQFGIDHAVSLSEDLLKGGAPGIHLYTLNKSVQSEPIIEALSSYF